MWGDYIEDFLAPLELGLPDLVKITGGWAFGFVDALQRAGWRPIIRSSAWPTTPALSITRSALWRTA